MLTLGMFYTGSLMCIYTIIMLHSFRLVWLRFTTFNDAMMTNVSILTHGSDLILIFWVHVSTHLMVQPHLILMFWVSTHFTVQTHLILMFWVSTHFTVQTHLILMFWVSIHFMVQTHLILMFWVSTHLMVQSEWVLFNANSAIFSYIMARTS